MQTEYEKNVVKAVISYYNHDYEVFLNYLDEAVIWFGPREGEYIVGKNNIRNALEKVNKKVKFKVEEVQTKLFPFSVNIYCVIVNFKLYVFKPDGSVKEHIQRITFNGRRCKDTDGRVFWRCPYIEVSNIIPKHERSRGILTVTRTLNDDENEALFFNGENHTTVVLHRAAIKYIEGGKGVFSYIHTDDDVIKVHHLLKDLEEILPNDFYRCHSSFIVNVKRISCMSSSSLTLNDGSSIPIPLKKSRVIINEIKELINKKMS